ILQSIAKNLRILRPFLSGRPPCLHHGRQFPPHGCTHWLPPSRFLLASLSLLCRSLSLLLCAPGTLRSGYFGSCRCTHGSTRPSAWPRIGLTVKTRLVRRSRQCWARSWCWEALTLLGGTSNWCKKDKSRTGLPKPSSSLERLTPAERKSWSPIKRNLRAGAHC